MHKSCKASCTFQRKIGTADFAPPKKGVSMYFSPGKLFLLLTKRKLSKKYSTVKLSAHHSRIADKCLQIYFYCNKKLYTGNIFSVICKYTRLHMNFGMIRHTFNDIFSGIFFDCNVFILNLDSQTNKTIILQHLRRNLKSNIVRRKQTLIFINDDNYLVRDRR